jgi:hypothetical protein
MVDNRENMCVCRYVDDSAGHPPQNIQGILVIMSRDDSNQVSSLDRLSLALDVVALQYIVHPILGLQARFLGNLTCFRIAAWGYMYICT